MAGHSPSTLAVVHATQSQVSHLWASLSQPVPLLLEPPPRLLDRHVSHLNALQAPTPLIALHPPIQVGEGRPGAARNVAHTQSPPGEMHAEVAVDAPKFLMKALLLLAVFDGLGGDVEDVKDDLEGKPEVVWSARGAAEGDDETSSQANGQLLYRRIRMSTTYVTKIGVVGLTG
jgi:hypothetical protein